MNLKVNTSTLEEWVRVYCKDGDILKIIKLEGESTIALQNLMTNSIFMFDEEAEEYGV